MEANVRLRAEKMMTPDRVAEIAKHTVEDLFSDPDLWKEVVHCQHSVCFEGGQPSREKLSVSWVDTVQRDDLNAKRFAPTTGTDAQTGVTLSAARSLPKSAALFAQIEELLWERIKTTTKPAPLPSRVPDDPALLAIYVKGVKLVYQLVKQSLPDQNGQVSSHDQKTYSHHFMSAGESAFGVLHTLDIIRNKDGMPPSDRYCAGPRTAVFVHPIEAVEELIEKRSETAPSLGHVLEAVFYMSDQFGRGFDLQATPAKVDSLARDFISVSRTAGLCATLGKDRALWLPFCDDDILSLYRRVDADHYEDDLFTPDQQTARLIRAKM